MIPFSNNQTNNHNMEGFQTILDITTDNIFSELLNSTNFESVVDGRMGAVLVDCKDDSYPLVRTTSVYNNPPQKFSPIHHKIIENIGEFNNALIEVYDSKYRKMKYHTDQSLDLADDSYICIFSCYENPTTTHIRKLKIKNKQTGNCSEILLKHNSIVLFSVATNKKHLHKIVLETKPQNERWLGITFRMARTFVKFVDGVPYIGNTILRIANDNEKKEFMKCKGLENLTVDYTYPEINYSISPSDLKPPVAYNHLDSN